VRTYVSLRVRVVHVCFVYGVHGIAAVNSIFACTASERAPIARSRIAAHEKWPSRAVIITRVMIRTYVCDKTTRRFVAVIIPVRSAGLYSHVFVAFTRSSPSRELNVIFPVIFAFSLSLSLSLFISPSFFLSLFYLAIDVTSAIVRRGIFHFARFPVDRPPSRVRDRFKVLLIPDFTRPTDPRSDQSLIRDRSRDALRMFIRGGVRDTLMRFPVTRCERYRIRLPALRNYFPSSGMAAFIESELVTETRAPGTTRLRQPFTINNDVRLFE